VVRAVVASPFEDAFCDPAKSLAHANGDRVIGVARLCRARGTMRSRGVARGAAAYQVRVGSCRLTAAGGTSGHVRAGWSGRARRRRAADARLLARQGLPPIRAARRVRLPG
jgi:hypothetical protein